MDIDIKGVIVSNDDKWIYSWFGMDSTSPKDVLEKIKTANGEDLNITINSPGGDVYAASEIYTALKEYKGNVTVKIVGVAASAAGVIAMAGKKVLISPLAQIMIHNVLSGAWGDYRDLQHESDVIKNYNTSIANAYILKTGLSQEEVLKLMDKETWLNAQQALEMKFVDGIMFSEEMKFTAMSKNTAIPQEIINKMRNYLNQEQQNKPDPEPDPEQPEEKQEPIIDELFLYQKSLEIKLKKYKEVC